MLHFTISIMNKCCPFVELGKKDAPPILFMSGFPDSELSAWGGRMIGHFTQTHRCIFMCLPGYSESDNHSLDTKWGYEMEVVLEMMHNTIHTVGLQEEPFILVSHDWGAYFSLLYTTRYPKSVSKLILCDIGMCSPYTLPFSSIPFIAFYQLFFAITYYISQTISLTLAEWLFISIGIKAFFNILSPTLLNRVEIPRHSLTVRKCYPYYYLWRRLLTLQLLPQAFPTCPVLFLVSTNSYYNLHCYDVL